MSRLFLFEWMRDGIPPFPIPEPIITTSDANYIPAKDGSVIRRQPPPNPGGKCGAGLELEVRNKSIRKNFKSEVPSMFGALKSTVDPRQGRRSRVDVFPRKFVEKILQDTEQVLQPESNESTQQEFDYYDLQLATWTTMEQAKINSITEELTSGSFESPIKIPHTHSNMLPEFEHLYGPVNEKKGKTEMYLKALLQSREESLEEFERKRELYKKVADKLGKDVALQALQYECDTVDCKAYDSGLFEKRAEKKQIYNLNPLTNSSHSDWFCLPRAHVNPKNMYLRHVELEGLMEFNVSKDATFTLDGYWPSLLDCGIKMFIPLSEDPLSPPDGFVERHYREVAWTPLYKNMCQYISHKPLGIALEKYFKSFAAEYKYKGYRRVFGALSHASVVDHLSDLFFKVALGDMTFVYPVHMRGIVPPPEDMMRRVWKRIELLVQMKGGFVPSWDLERQYASLFQLATLTQDWGFASIEEFVKYCKDTWDPVDGAKVHLVGVRKCKWSMLMYFEGKIDTI